MIDLDDLRTCRFCHQQDSGLIKYDVRHYAHTRCLRDAKGVEFLLALPTPQLARVAPLKLPRCEQARVFAAYCHRIGARSDDGATEALDPPCPDCGGSGVEDRDVDGVAGERACRGCSDGDRSTGRAS